MTEAGFGADLGAEKFFNIKCRKAGLKPAAAAIVATVRAMKMNGGVAKAALGTENVAAVQAGCPNLGRHIDNVKRFGVPVVVAINHFSDTDAEVAAVKAYVAERGASAFLCKHWAQGSAGNEELAHHVVTLADSGSARFAPIYPDEMTLFAKIETIARTIYCADVDADPSIRDQLKAWEVAGYGHLPVCIAKTQYSFTTNPKNSWRAHRLYHSGARSSAVGGSGIYCGHLWGHHDDAGPAERAERGGDPREPAGLCRRFVLSRPSCHPQPCAWSKDGRQDH